MLGWLELCGARLDWFGLDWTGLRWYFFKNFYHPFSVFQVDASFDPEDAKKVLYWIKAATGQQFPIEESNERYKVMENFYKVLKDGRLLCR